jgi:hypothetical protein
MLRFLVGIVAAFAPVSGFCKWVMMYEMPQ